MTSSRRVLEVDLGERAYPIYIGRGLLGNPDYFRQHIDSEKIMVVSNEKVAPLYLQKLLPALGDYQVQTVVLPDGEQFKTLETLDSIFSALLEQRFDRTSTLLALGGGVVGDMTGFAAACYQRGIDFVQVPTTLLAQVDSSVGGKTGVNHALGKNMIGAFHQPRCVVADTETLSTLDDRQLSAGLAEVIKYGLINDPEFFAWLEESMDLLLQRDDEALSYAIERSCQDKADIVAADEREAGQRALLNLGHTFGHAIETGMGYGTWLHGEAVAAGMCMAATLSRDLGWIDNQDVERISRLIERARLPVRPPSEMTVDQFTGLMAVDKKVLKGQLRLVLMQSVGTSVVTSDFDKEQLAASIAGYY